MSEGPDRELIEKLEARLQGNPDGRVFVPLADAYRRVGEHDRARELLEEGLRRHPDVLSAHVVAGRVARDRGDAEAAREAFREALDADPENVEARAALDDAPDADEDVFDFGALAGSEGAPGVEEPGAEEDAIHGVDELDDDVLERGMPTRTLGELYARQGHYDRAVEVYEDLLEEEPDDEVLGARLEELREEARDVGAAEDADTFDFGSAFEEPSGGDRGEGAFAAAFESGFEGEAPPAEEAEEDAAAEPEPDPAITGEEREPGFEGEEPEPAAFDAGDEGDEAVAADTLAEEWAAGPEETGELSTPFAWSEGPEDRVEEAGRTIGSYLSDLLAPRAPSGDAPPSEEAPPEEVAPEEAPPEEVAPEEAPAGDATGEPLPVESPGPDEAAVAGGLDEPVPIESLAPDEPAEEPAGEALLRGPFPWEEPGVGEAEETTGGGADDAGEEREASGEEDEDLEMFQAWLKSLKE